MIIHDMEQGSPEWVAVRCGVPTASEFGRIITGTGKPSTQLSDYAAQLAAEAYAKMPLDRWEGSADTERGHDIEHEARTAYSFLNDADVTQVGFITNHGAGASPDGLVGDDGLLEIKCLKAKNHVSVLAYIRKHGRCPPDYIPQARGQLLVTDREWVDLMFYHPSLPEAVVRVLRDAVYDAVLLAQIDAVIGERDALIKTIEGYS